MDFAVESCSALAAVEPWVICWQAYICIWVLFTTAFEVLDFKPYIVENIVENYFFELTGSKGLVRIADSIPGVLYSELKSIVERLYAHFCVTPFYG